MTPEELYLANEKLAYWTLARHYPNLQFDEDTRQIARLGLWKACLEYKEDMQIKFSSYACRCVLNELRNYFRDKHRMRRDDSSDVSLSTVVGDNDMVLADVIPGDKDAIFIDFNGFWDSLTEREKKIIRMLTDGFTNRQIGNSFGISHQRIAQLRLRIKQKFLAYV